MVKVCGTLLELDESFIEHGSALIEFAIYFSSHLFLSMGAHYDHIRLPIMNFKVEIGNLKTQTNHKSSCWLTIKVQHNLNNKKVHALNKGHDFSFNARFYKRARKKRNLNLIKMYCVCQKRQC